NGLASLQEGRVRYTKSAFVHFTPEGQKTEVRFANSAIRNKKRFTYEQVTALLDAADAGGERTPLLDTISPEILALLLRMRELAMILRKRRRKRGALELTMPEVELEYDDEGRLTGGHFASHDVSHEIIEEFMLTANE